ncbi:MAG: hypothetical protein NTZ27_10840 [Ignavibacteriales bacterium]|nr:hypothetical protein [Ignavibacteriales bacterium]
MYSKRYIRRIGFSISILLFVIVAAGCSSVKETTSYWRNNEIKIDGDISDWQNTLESTPDKKFAVGFKNDDKFLYISLITDDRAKIMQMLRTGFITWLTPNGDDDKKFGIKFPLSNKEIGVAQFHGMNREMIPPENTEKIITQLLNEQKELEIINKDKFPLNLLSLENTEGIKLALGYKANNFVYELQIPLASSNYPTKINSLPGGKVIVYFETGKSEFENATGRAPESEVTQRGGNQMPGGQRGGGQRGGGRMRQGAPGLQNSEPINYSFDVILQQHPK